MILKSYCSQSEVALKNDGQSDIDGYDLFVELKLLRELLSKEKLGPLAVLNFVKDRGCFCNAVIANRIPLTIPVTVTSAERNLFKLKFLKSYFIMSQERLTRLVLISIESDVLKIIMKVLWMISLQKILEGVHIQVIVDVFCISCN